MMIADQKTAILGDGLTGQSLKRAFQKWGVQQVDPDQAELIVSSPGIPPDQTQYDVPVISDIEWAYLMWRQLFPDQFPTLIAVTGTNGKTTVTEMLSAALSCPAAGNIGTVFADFIGQNIPYLVLELSSFQLHRTQLFRPDLAIVTNIDEDHLEWHQGADHYAESKRNIAVNQRSTDHLVILESETNLIELFSELDVQKCLVSNSDIHSLKQRYPQFLAAHHYQNLGLVIRGLATIGHVDESWVDSFELAEHRLECLDLEASFLVVNDSKSTNFHATQSAIQSFKDRPICLLMGGYDKGLDMNDAFLDALSQVDCLILFGASEERFYRILKAGLKSTIIIRAGELENACHAAVPFMKEQSVLLFSPACSSFDAYQSYQERGAHFKSLIQDLIADETQFEL